MDILKYSALNVINNTCAFINGGANTAANTAGFNAGSNAASGFGLSDAANWQANGTTYVAHQTLLGAGWCNAPDNMPWCHCAWVNSIPRMPGSTGTANAGINFVTGAEYCGFKVCGANFLSNASNVWTVPAGTQYARFQVWGAGGNGGSGCCCGGSPWGISGAYASIIIPVVPGCQYTLCAGCARNTTTIWSSWGGRGCRSFVTGFGLCNFCADAGECLNLPTVTACHWCQYSATGCQRWAAPDCLSSSGGCWCNSGLDWCFSSSCASCGCLPYARATDTNYYGCYNGTLSAYSTVLNINFLDAMQVTGVPGLHGAMCFDTNYYGWSCAPAVYGYETTTQCVICYNGGSTCGGLCCNPCGYNYRRAPGAGATSTHLFGGCTAMCDPSGNLSCGGDIGRGGMVCVTWF